MFGSKPFAINFSDYSVDVLELEQGKDGYTIKASGRLTIDPGIVINGKIVKSDKLREIIKELLRGAKPQPITGRDVILTLPESRVFVQTFELSRSVAPKQVPTTLFNEAQQSLPIDPQQIASDYVMVGKRGDLVEYLFAATYKELVEEYVKFFESMQLHVVSLTMESLALSKAVLDEKNAETVLLLDIGSRTTIASIFKSGSLQETININIAGNNINTALAEKLKITVSEAEKRKVSVGMKSDATNGGAEMLVIQGQMQPLKDELLLFIKYYEGKTGNTIDRVLLAGGTAALKGLDDYLASNFNIPVSLAKPSSEYSIAVPPESLARFLVVLGLATMALDLRKIEIDFLTKQDKELQKSGLIMAKPMALPEAVLSGKDGKKKKGSSKRSTIILLIILLVAFGVVGALLWFKYASPTEPVIPPLIDIRPQIENQVTPLDKSINFVIKPANLSDASAIKSMAYMYSVHIDTEASTKPLGPGEILGFIDTLIFEGTQQYDASVVDKVKKSISSGSSEPSSNEVENAVRQELAKQLWKDQLKKLTTSAEQANRLLIPDYLAVSIISFDKQADEKLPGVTTVKIRAQYQMIALSDRDILLGLESKNLKFFYDENPGYALQSVSYKFDTSSAPSTYRVIAQYSFAKNDN